MKLFSEDKAIVLLRYSLGVTFVWFGILKLFNVSPVLEVIKLAMPPVFAESQLFFFLLSLFEILIGVAFFMKRLTKLAAVAMILYLLVATFSVLFTQGFSPRFPLLSFAGEFVMKNFVLMAAGLVLLTHSVDKKVEEKKQNE